MRTYPKRLFRRKFNDAKKYGFCMSPNNVVPNKNEEAEQWQTVSAEWWSWNDTICFSYFHECSVFDNAEIEF